MLEGQLGCDFPSVQQISEKDVTEPLEFLESLGHWSQLQQMQDYTDIDTLKSDSHVLQALTMCLRWGPPSRSYQNSRVWGMSFGICSTFRWMREVALVV